MAVSSPDRLERPLARWRGAPPPAPDWFQRALEIRPVVRRVEVEGASIEFLAWGKEGAPGVLLLHGFAGHARWWDHIAPFLVAGHRVVAVTWSGMGNSGWRLSYCIDQYAREALAVVRAERLFEASRPPVLIAHSLGGVPLLRLVERHGGRIGRVVLIDTLLKPSRGPALTGRVRDVRLVADPATLIERFRLSPPSECPNPFILDHFARFGIVEDMGPDGARGFRWGMDPNLRERLATSDVLDILDRAPCPITLLIGEQSKVVPLQARLMLAAKPRSRVAIIAIPEAGHHVLADQPIALIAALRTLIDPSGSVDC